MNPEHHLQRVPRMADNAALGFLTTLALSALACVARMVITKDASDAAVFHVLFEPYVLAVGSIAIGLVCYRSARVRKCCIALLVVLMSVLLLMQLFSFLREELASRF
ncbi:hypothetical protein [Prosthecobacter fluviatilis]|uniref:Uncharacterized protein n=1 Tax=Prosthecobacter fluviatilis TaxID=445931 RepID=A0ABW0KUH6_9BACT